MNENSIKEPSHTLTVPAPPPSGRLDAWVASQIPTLSRSRVQSLLRDGHIQLNGSTTTARANLHAADVITVTEPETVSIGIIKQDIPLTILFEDADIIVVDKPAGLVVHPAPGHPDGTLVNALLHLCPDIKGIGGELRPGIIHRLDADTSGVIVVAKNSTAMDSISAQFRARTTEKHYTAIVHGVPAPGVGTISTQIGRSTSDRKKMTVSPPRGRDAISHYTLLKALPNKLALLDVRIETGRTHQIRVHLNHIQHPIVADPIYGSRPRDRALRPCPPRLMLHATTLTITHPRSDQRITLSAPLPADMLAVITSS